MAQLLRDAGHWCKHDEFTDEAGVAFLLSQSRRTVARYRAEDRKLQASGKPALGPFWCETSRIVYDLEKLEAWIEAGGRKKSHDRACQLMTTDDG